MCWDVQPGADWCVHTNERRIEMTNTQEFSAACAVLGVELGATLTDVKKAYRDRAILLHPDKHNHSTSASESAARAMQQLNDAHQVLVRDILARAATDTGYATASPSWRCPRCATVFAPGATSSVRCPTCDSALREPAAPRRTAAPWAPVAVSKEHRPRAPIVVSVVIVLLAMMTISALTRGTSSKTATPAGAHALAAADVGEGSVRSSANRTDTVRQALADAGYPVDSESDETIDGLEMSYCDLAGLSSSSAEFQHFLVQLVGDDLENTNMYAIEAVMALTYYCPEYHELLGT